MLDTHREMYKLAGVRIWQEAVMAAWRAAGPEAQRAFLDYLQQHGHLHLAPIEASAMAVATPPPPEPVRQREPDLSIDVEDDETEDADPLADNENA